MMKHILKPANLFTSGSLFCGLYSVMVSAGAEPHEVGSFYTAALLIIFAGIFDGLDGRVARLTNTQSDFGVELDSLVDVVSFGVAPAVLLFKWGLEAYGRGGLIVAFLFTLCGVFRLARFNMEAHQGGTDERPKKYTEGLTITCAGGMVAVLVLHHAKVRATEVDSHISVLLLTLMLSYLMISTVGFRTYREFRLSPLSISMVAVGAAAMVAVLVVYDITLLLVLMGGTYIGSGLIDEAFSFTRSRRADDFYYLGSMEAAEEEEEADEEARI